MRVLFCEGIYPHLSESYIALEIDFALRNNIDVRVWSQQRPVLPLSGLPEQVPTYRGLSLSDTAALVTPDLLHFDSAILLTEKAAEVAALNLAVTLRGHSQDHDLQRLARLLSQPWLHRVYLFPHVAERVRSPKVIAVPACYDGRLFKPGAEKNPSLVLRTGAALPFKGLEDFLAVASLCPEHEFVLAVGRSPAFPDYVTKLQAKRPRNVAIMVDVPHAQLALWYQRAAIFLHTSDPNAHPFGMPVSILEASASGCVVLAREGRNTYGIPKEAAEMIQKPRDPRESDWAIESAKDYEHETVLNKIVEDWLGIYSRSDGLATTRASEMANDAWPRYDLTKYPIEDCVWVEVYWRDDAAGRGPCASLYVQDVELLRFDCFDGDQGHCHINLKQNRRQRWYYRPGTVRQHIDQSAHDLSRNVLFALRSNSDPAIQRTRIDPEKLQEVGQQMREKMLAIASQLGL